jgi:hypothetical protein
VGEGPDAPRSFAAWLVIVDLLVVRWREVVVAGHVSEMLMDSR